MEELDHEKEQFDLQVAKIEQTAIRVHEDSEFTAAHRQEYEENKAELDRLKYELETEKAHLRTEHIRLEERRHELSMRQRMMEQLRLQSFDYQLDEQKEKLKWDNNLQTMLEERRGAPPKTADQAQRTGLLSSGGLTR